MGIKGIYKEIGPGERISLCKLAVEKIEQTGQPFRLAIDISIWQFQVQAARGGSNPAIRTLFYRLVRLLGLAIQPIFVFDGPNKPTFKRNKRSGRGDGVATAMAKRLIRLFGFAIHDAPGEAEAECALLQQQGVVDAVLSEDVDTIMFGCRRTLRSWTAEGTKGSKTPTHVSMYNVDKLAGASSSTGGISGLDREGMVLVALMSGGDYLPEGVPGCGVKVACEAARAGFGRDLCRIKKADTAGLAAWKKKLLHELQTNESGFFRTRHKALVIPDTFPSLEVLRYYTHPIVSQQNTVDRLKRDFPTTVPVDVQGLREFVRETFDWTFRIGAVKFIRVLAPSLLVQLLLQRMETHDRLPDDLNLKQTWESSLVKAVSSRRSHFSTDATPELRLSYVPADIVGIDLKSEPEEEVEAYGRSGIALNSDDEFDEEVAEELASEQSKGVGKKFDPLQPDLAWIPESVAKLGVPLTVEIWEEKQHAKISRAAAKAAKTRTKKTGMPVGALDKYVRSTKNTMTNIPKHATPPVLASSPPGFIPDVFSSENIARSQISRSIATQAPKAAPAGVKSKQSKKPSKAKANKPTAGTNPWALAGSQVSPRVTKSAASSSAQDKLNFIHEPIFISSSPVAPPAPSPSSTHMRGRRSPTKTKRLQSSSNEDPFPSDPINPPTPIPQKQKAPGAAAKQGPEKRVSKGPSRPATRARPFMRTKSGAEEELGVNMTQTSITAYGHLVKYAGQSAWGKGKEAAAAATTELLSDDEDDEAADTSFPSLKTLIGRSMSEAPSRIPPPTPPPAPNWSLDVSDDDDPFATKSQAKPGQPWLKAREAPLPPNIIKVSTTSNTVKHKKNGRNDEELDSIFFSSEPEDSGRSDDKNDNSKHSNKGMIAGISAGLGYTGTSASAFTSLKTASVTDLGKGEHKKKSGWRFSNASVVDLTGDD
ncbi:hypothetical protein B0H66DRAFT_563663 [Apodospora peruviana]|uniref:Flap structure-specific endonuclease n=1 Tax=Apodospora peruviana TaxID=516989 RepID=A0AAE0HXQ9_9PEZI|nr:hypothetical protein B0H66DRAFT_563663 [Apodospora peruviana]